MKQIRVAKEQEQRLILTQQAKAHPLVKQALEMFGGELAEVRNDGSGAGVYRNEESIREYVQHLKQAQAMQEQMAKAALPRREGLACVQRMAGESLRLAL